jgi:DNA-directed RNA polymerase subunit RPC12/RpoP
MSYDAKCPHCNEEFDVDDHHESGAYHCPECDKKIWIEVEYTATYDAQCMPQDHQWKHYPYIKHDEVYSCEKCSKVRFKSEEKAGE